MFKSNLLFTLFAMVLEVAVSSCCCCHEDDDYTCSDLTVQDIDANQVDVSCPGGFGTCVTTLTFTVENIGNAVAGGFVIRVVLDPSSSVVLNEFVPGLGASDSINVTVMSPPGGNCYDPGLFYQRCRRQ